MALYHLIRKVQTDLLPTIGRISFLVVDGKECIEVKDNGEGRWLMVLYTIFDTRPNVLGESLISLLHPDGESIYIARMVAAPFLMSSLSLTSNDTGKQVLEIGLGGGTFDMGLHTIKPEVNITAVDIDELDVKIAFKYFGVSDSKYHHSVVQDGIKFVEDAIAKAEGAGTAPKKVWTRAKEATGPSNKNNGEVRSARKATTKNSIEEVK
ncbi:hypothetical protein TELCIR_13952 [Teladorsagia circumcincta]|uniref:Uncharacterized protein n=1 Tax=Teladorsagia circumcincta TaxID=45464 RepID=A0A2G9U4I9_TELCI|nr:hypothetical protein TELCIR_13952 [Teladorsagia circumcincta]